MRYVLQTFQNVANDISSRKYLRNKIHFQQDTFEKIGVSRNRTYWIETHCQHLKYTNYNLDFCNLYKKQSKEVLKYSFIHFLANIH